MIKPPNRGVNQVCTKKWRYRERPVKQLCDQLVEQVVSRQPFREKCEQYDYDDTCHDSPLIDAGRDTFEGNQEINM
jgi:hypothetical protein